MVNKIFMLLLVLVALGSLVQLGGGQTTDSQSFMRAKLSHSQTVLEGLATENYDAIAENANSLVMLSQDTDWYVIQTAEYRRHSDEFRRQARALTEAAQNENLDGATLAYLQMTLSCIECHKHVRHVRGQPEKKQNKKGG